MKEIALEMVRDDMDHLPAFSCPPGYTIRTFRRGDERLWAKTLSEAGEFATPEQAVAHFELEFGPCISELEDRCFLLEDHQGETIGTATAWYRSSDGEVRGRVHWVGIVPGSQRRKLSKSLLCAVVDRLATDHQKTYLTTQTTSYPAVNFYLSFGFVPSISTDRDEKDGR